MLPLLEEQPVANRGGPRASGGSRFTLPIVRQRIGDLARPTGHWLRCQGIEWRFYCFEVWPALLSRTLLLQAGAIAKQRKLQMTKSNQWQRKPSQRIPPCAITGAIAG